MYYSLVGTIWSTHQRHKMSGDIDFWNWLLTPYVPLCRSNCSDYEGCFINKKKNTKHSDSTFSRFRRMFPVCNEIELIQSITDTDVWHHVPLLCGSKCTDYGGSFISYKKQDSFWIHRFSFQEDVSGGKLTSSSPYVSSYPNEEDVYSVVKNLEETRDEGRRSEKISWKENWRNLAFAKQLKEEGRGIIATNLPL